MHYHTTNGAKLNRHFRKAAGAIPVDYKRTLSKRKLKVTTANAEQLQAKQARLQWLFDAGMKCDQLVTWGCCTVGDIDTLNWLHTVKQCKVDERYQFCYF
jgi:hypothetical protein